MLNPFKNLLNEISPISEKELNDNEVLSEIEKIKQELTNNVVILAHHYQQDDIIRFADVKGDSLELAKQIKNFKDKKFIVFCGVHFMAETADMLAFKNQTILLPDINAGCFLADTAKEKDINKAWKFLNNNAKEKIIPITYINSTASLKAFVGKNQGAVCTSSNAESIIKWAFSKGKKLFFLPDQHLGRNTCYKLNIPLEKMALYDPLLKNGGMTDNEKNNAIVYLWNGYCSVHRDFSLSQIKRIRKKYPEMKIIVHPECSFDVVQNSDFCGSTSFIIKHIEEANTGSQFAVGTEFNLVNRLSSSFNNKKIISLSKTPCLCETMFRIRPRWLLSTLRSIKNKKPHYVIKVSDKIKKNALKAIDKMISIV